MRLTAKGEQVANQAAMSSEDDTAALMEALLGAGRPALDPVSGARQRQHTTMSEWVCTRCLVAMPSTEPLCPHCGRHRAEVSDMDGKPSGGDLPRTYTVTYEGSSHDDAQYQAELDEGRHALDGYTPTRHRWVEEGWNAGNVAGTLSGLLAWGGMWRQHRDRAEKSALFGPPAVLEVTYSLEAEVPAEE
jgi:hypothetical protein